MNTSTSTIVSTLANFAKQNPVATSIVILGTAVLYIASKDNFSATVSWNNASPSNLQEKEDG